MGSVAGLFAGGAVGAFWGDRGEDALRDALFAEEHTKNARPSTKGKHQKGRARNKRDYGNEKGDEDRRGPRKRPPNHKEPWPPKSVFPFGLDFDDDDDDDACY